MCKQVTNLVASTNNNAAMESENHLKNDVSPKNQRNRGNFFILSVLVLAFFGVVNNAVGQYSGPWDIGHNPAPGGDYLPNVTATLNGNTLTIAGSGNMADFECTGTNQYDAGGEAPWWFAESIRNAIHTVAFQNGSNVQNIGKRAFKNCSNLETISIPNTVVKINSEAFLYCGNLHTITIEDGSDALTFSDIRCPGTSIYKYDWFLGCNSLNTLYLGREIAPWGTSNNQPISYIKNSLTTLTIGEKVNEIGNHAFDNCESLNTVIIEDKCTGSLTFSGSIMTGDSHFQNCKIETLYLGRHLTTGGYNNGTPFAGNTWLKSVTIGNCVENINAGSFKGCSKLELLTLNNMLKTIGSSAFENCSMLSGLALPQGVENIGTMAFKGCSILPSLTIPNSVTEIGNHAFDNCESLNTVIIEDKCTGSLTFSGSIMTGDSHFQNCKIETLYLGRHLTTGGYNNGTPFAGNTWLKSVTIGNCVTKINEYSFYNCTGLKSAIIGSSVTEIGNYAFSGCCELEEITSLPTNPPMLYQYTFGGCGKSVPNCTVYVCPSCIEDYQNAPYWSEFTNYQPLGIEETSLSQIQIFPNPTNNEIFIQFDLQVEKVEIYSLTGTLLKSENNFKEKISVSTLSSGIYFLKIHTERGLTVRKVVKE